MNVVKVNNGKEEKGNIIESRNTAAKNGGKAYTWRGEPFQGFPFQLLLLLVLLQYTVVFQNPVMFTLDVVAH